MEVLAPVSIGAVPTPVIVLADLGLVLVIEMLLSPELMSPMSEAALVPPLAVTLQLEVLTELSLVLLHISLVSSSLLLVAVLMLAGVVVSVNMGGVGPSNLTHRTLGGLPQVVVRLLGGGPATNRAMRALHAGGLRVGVSVSGVRSDGGGAQGVGLLLDGKGEGAGLDVELGVGAGWLELQSGGWGGEVEGLEEKVDLREAELLLLWLVVGVGQGRVGVETTEVLHGGEAESQTRRLQQLVALLVGLAGWEVGLGG